MNCKNEADLNFMHTLYELDNFLNAGNFDTSCMVIMHEVELLFVYKHARM